MEKSAKLEMSANQFQQAGQYIIEKLTAFLESIDERKMVSGSNMPLEKRPLPEQGSNPMDLLKKYLEPILENTFFNGNPKFMGYVISSPAPIGALADLIASFINANCGGWNLAPMANAIEKQTIQWITEMIGFGKGSGGTLTSGGTTANFTGLLAARTAYAKNVRKKGLKDYKMVIYATQETHTWLNKAADLLGFGTDAIRWIRTINNQMDTIQLEHEILLDKVRGLDPFVVVANAGTVSSGTVDPLLDIAAVCTRYNIWMHVDGAYGGFAAALPEASKELKSIMYADSVALDPHKWLYAPVEAGCILVKDPKALQDTFSYKPAYYNFNTDDDQINYHEYGIQNSRSFKALKVWLCIQQAGKEGYLEMWRENIRLSRYLANLVTNLDNFQLADQNLSITTFRYIPSYLQAGDPEDKKLIDQFNQDLLNKIQAGGEFFISNAVVNGSYVLRACIVNFRTREKDLEQLIAAITREAKQIEAEMLEQKIKFNKAS